MPGSPNQWSRWKCVMKTASTSGSPVERSSWRWVPSPQSNSRRSPPARISVAGRPRRAVGTLPPVPAKKTERSTGSSAHDDDLEGDAAVLDRRHAHRVRGRAAALGRRAGVEDLEALALFVLGHVGVAEDDGVAAGE